MFKTYCFTWSLLRPIYWQPFVLYKKRGQYIGLCICLDCYHYSCPTSLFWDLQNMHSLSWKFIQKKVCISNVYVEEIIHQKYNSLSNKVTE